jgi:hypothetical protein
MLTKINPSKYITKVFGENSRWKVQKQVFFSHFGQIWQENIKTVQKLRSGAIIQVNPMDAHKAESPFMVLLAWVIYTYLPLIQFCSMR